MFVPTQVVEEQMEGSVVMVTLGAAGGVAAVEEERGTSYVELKPSTTLLVPLELMEGHQGLVGCPQQGAPELHRAPAQDEQAPETRGDFTLMLDADDEVKDAEVPPLNEDLEFSLPPTLSPAVGDEGDGDYEPTAKLEVLLSEKDAQDVPGPEEAPEDRTSVVRAEGGDSSAEILDTDENHQPEDAATLPDAELAAEDEEPAGPVTPEASPQQELPGDAVPSVAAEEEGPLDDESPETEARQEEAEKNGPVGADAAVGASREAEPAAVEKIDRKASETEEGRRGTAQNVAGGPREQAGIKEEAAPESPVLEEPVEETPAPREKKPSPVKPARRTGRAKSVAFSSSFTEEKEELQEDGKPEEARSHEAPAALRREPRKSRQNKEPAVTPRRSSRRAQQEPPEEAAEAAHQGATGPAASKASSPARRRLSTRSSQSGHEEASATEPEGSEEDGADTKPPRRAGSRAVPEAPRRTARRSSRRMQGSADVAPLPLEVVKEENEQEAAFPSVKHTPKQTKAEAEKEEEQEEQERKAQVRTPGRPNLFFYVELKKKKKQMLRFHSVGSVHLICRFPGRLSQSTKKMKRRTGNENRRDDGGAPDPESLRSSLRPKRGRLWDHPEEELPLLPSPLEVDSETPVADALIKRLQDEEEKQEGTFEIAGTLKVDETFYPT